MFHKVVPLRKILDPKLHFWTLKFSAWTLKINFGPYKNFAVDLKRFFWTLKFSSVDLKLKSVDLKKKHCTGGGKYSSE